MSVNMEAAAAPGIYLQPGDIRFFIPAPGVLRPPRLHTLLGSCVSVILWHPERRIGGMSHMILPECGRRLAVPASDGRYCDGAIALFRREILRAGTLPSQFAVYLVGGGRMYDSLTVMAGQTVGERNIEAARSHLRAAGFRAPIEDAGEEGYRKVELDLSRGTVTVLASTRRRILSVI
ncbi:MAG TPA: chemotaxis protein CheD [Rhodocyclaceae bacterium]|nr:chemotaxis protein CheD [Rhodocyclaceae bacterium]